MECKLKIVLADVHYIYAGYPHDDEEFQVSVWDGENRIPIGDVARTMHAAGDSYADRRTAISEKYGSDFADKFLQAFLEGWWPEIKEEDDIFGRLSLCMRPTTEEIEKFCSSLVRSHIAVTVRQEMGTDIQAACGQLRNRHIEEQRRF